MSSSVGFLTEVTEWVPQPREVAELIFDYCKHLVSHEMYVE